MNTEAIYITADLTVAIRGGGIVSISCEPGVDPLREARRALQRAEERTLELRRAVWALDMQRSWGAREED